jgi:hypothetical protein
MLLLPPAGEALALASSLSRPSIDVDAAAAAAEQPDEDATIDNKPKPCPDAKPAAAVLEADSSRQIDAATQVTPKVADSVAKQARPRACACCTVM